MFLVCNNHVEKYINNKKAVKFPLPSLSQRDQTIPGLAGDEQERGMRERHEGEKNEVAIILFYLYFIFMKCYFYFFFGIEDRNDGKLNFLIVSEKKLKRWRRNLFCEFIF